MSFQCSHCKKGEPLYKCPTCGAMGHIDKKKKEVMIHPPPSKLPTKFDPYRPPSSFCFPSHFDCELGKPVDQIDLKKLLKVEVKKQ